MFIITVFIALHAAANPTPPRNFLFLASGHIRESIPLLKRGDIEGAQIVYKWKDLELAKDKYDFSALEKDLDVLDSLRKKLFIQIQDRFFDINARNVPAYLLIENQYQGGLAPQVDNAGENMPQGDGWVAMQWNPAVQSRFHKLLAALAKRFDGKVYGVNLSETSIDIDIQNDKSGFSCEKYFNAEIANMIFARKVFTKTYIVQYVNFFPCEWDNDHKFMSRLFEAALAYDIGLGGPDIIPGKNAQLKNSYPFFHRYKSKLKLVAMAVQEPTLTYRNPLTKKPFSKNEFVEYAQSYLGADIIFWSCTSPWLLGKP